MGGYKEKIVWITGASSGIGEHLAYTFAYEGARLILSSRNITELERVKKACEEKGGKASVYSLDLSSPEQIDEVSKKVLDQYVHIDVLINNGGISQRALFTETSMEVDRRIMEVNFFGAAALTKKVIHSMLSHGGGHLVVISSLTGKFGFPLRSAYAASKHAVLGYFESIYAELHDKNIKVTMVCPGRIRTNVSQNALNKDGRAYGKMDEGQDKGLAPETCAKKIVKAMKRNKKEVYIGKLDVIMIYIKRYFPALFYKIVSKVSPT